jgi:excisionase family DNA binding protein
LEGEELISLAEAAAISGLHRGHLRRLAEQGELKARKIARNWVTTRRAVEEYLGDIEKRKNDPWKKRR